MYIPSEHEGSRARNKLYVDSINKLMFTLMEMSWWRWEQCKMDLEMQEGGGLPLSEHRPSHSRQMTLLACGVGQLPLKLNPACTESQSWALDSRHPLKSPNIS